MEGFDLEGSITLQLFARFSFFIQTTVALTNTSHAIDQVLKEISEASDLSCRFRVRFMYRVQREIKFP